MQHLLLLTLAILDVVASLSLPLNLVLLPARSPRNSSIRLPNLLNATNATSNGWPAPPFRSKISEEDASRGIADTTYLIIDQYLAPNPASLKGAILGNISLIEQTIEGYGNPDYYIDNSRVFKSGLVKARFPAFKGSNGPRITNGLARELMSAAWSFLYVYGPRGFSFATVQSGRGQGSKNSIGYFSLWIEGEVAIERYYGA
ncbi:hypothetical protein ACLMJK_001975 [Lecanora helva]